MSEPERTVADDAPIALSSAIRALRRELVEAVKEGKDQDVRFALGPIELELQVEVASAGGGEAGIKFDGPRRRADQRLRAGTLYRDVSEAARRVAPRRRCERLFAPAGPHRRGP